MGKKVPLADAALLFKALGDQTRLRILLLLERRGEMSASELGEAVGMQRMAVGHHVAKLCLHGVIDRRRRGQRRSYTLAAAGLVHDLLRFVKPERQPRRGGSGIDGTGRGYRTGPARPHKAARRL
jgi:DNA-binding transcriptional ArsR family regulator